MDVMAKGIPRGCKYLFTPVFLGYPLSVLNKKFALKERKKVLRGEVNAYHPLRRVVELGIRHRRKKEQEFYQAGSLRDNRLLHTTCNLS